MRRGEGSREGARKKVLRRRRRRDRRAKKREGRKAKGASHIVCSSFYIHPPRSIDMIRTRSPLFLLERQLKISRRQLVFFKTSDSIHLKSPRKRILGFRGRSPCFNHDPRQQTKLKEKLLLYLDRI